MAMCNAEHLRGYRIKIYPSEEQKKKIDRNIELYRAVYNLALEIQEKNHKAGGKFIKYFELAKIFSNMRKQEEYKWLNEITLGTIRQALVDVVHAYEKFFIRQNNHPNFKTKKYSSKSFTCRCERTHIRDGFIQLEGFSKDKIDAGNNPIPIGSKLYNTTVSFDGYDYWFSCTVEKDYIDMSNIEVSEPLGVDLGIRDLATLSDGTTYHLPDITKLEKRKKRQQRKCDKDYNKLLNISKQTRTKFEDVPRTKNMIKRAKALRKTCNKITNIKRNYIHNMTKDIVSRNPSTIVLEDLRVMNMIEGIYDRSSIPNMMFYEIRRQIEYKAEDRGIPVIIADMYYPSSKLCSNCGHKHTKLGSKKIYKCPVCGYIIDRDLNAAINLRNLATPIIPIIYDNIA